ncbi:helix-turn-helix domain-containing protein [Streptomyces noursei]|uniref:helix-turn-helix domain-containing protein n=1 Tax=Streptomyces noursei TaxID=1971 RepID=UPI0036849F55
MTQRGFDDEDEDDVPEWVDQVMATVAKEVRRRRKELGMSAQSLADACEEIGHPIPRNVIANMESGRRASLPLVDVMVLAEALHTNPICLIYPVGYVEQVQKLPLRHSEQTWDAMRWFTGAEPGEPLALDLMLRLFHQHESEQRALHAAESSEQDEAWKAKSASDAAQREEALSAQAFYAERAALAKERLRRLRSSIREEGGTPPMLMPSRFASPFDDNNHLEEDF